MILGIMLFTLTLWLIMSFFRLLWKGRGAQAQTGTIIDRLLNK